MSMKEAIKKFTDGISDLTNLEVLTYTGKVEQIVDAATGKIRWDEFKPTSGKLVLVAATVVRPNLDTVNFRASESGGLGHDELKALIELHTAATESAQNGRMALTKMFAGMVSGLL